MAPASASFPSYGAVPPAYNDDDSDQTLANTPLLPKSASSIDDDDDDDDDGDDDNDDGYSERSPLVAPMGEQREPFGGQQTPVRTDHERTKQRQGSPLVLVIALGLLCSLMVLILFIGFVFPEAAQEYAKKAAQVRLDSVSVDSLTPNAVRVRVKARVTIDANRLRSSPLKGFGILVGSVAGQVQIGSSEATLYLPDYPDGVLGTASYPNFAVNLGNGQYTDIDIICEVVPGSVEGIKPVVSDYLDGKIHSLTVHVESNMPLKSGLLPLGIHKVIEEIVLKDIPHIPAVELSRLNLSEIDLPGQSALGANVTVEAKNDYPISVKVPALSFSVLLLSCDQQPTEVAVARTSEVDILPYQPIVADVKGIIQSIPFALTERCPKTGTSPLDDLLGQYVRGHSSTAYIRGLPSDSEDNGLPPWLENFLTSIIIPVPFPGGHAFKDIIKSFSLTDVDFQFPDLGAEPDSPESSPILSATVQAVIRLPEEINTPVDVSKIQPSADIFYHGKKLGEFHVPDWAPTTTAQDKKNHELEINSRIENVPLNITDADVLSEVVQKIYFGGGGVKLQAIGTADAQVAIGSLGSFIIRGIPAQGDIVIKGGNYTLDDIQPRPSNVRVLSSTESSVKLSANVAFINPTNYTAAIPYFNIAILKNGTTLGNATVRGVGVGLGENRAMVEAVWAPLDGGDEARTMGIALLNDYISGKNATIAVRVHEGSLPPLPGISKALGALEFNIPLPRIPSDDNPDIPGHSTNNSRFIQSATLHIVGRVGVASYNGTILGTLNYTYQFAVPPGVSETPKLPVQLNLSGSGYKFLWDARGGMLQIDATAQCNIKLDRWEERLDFEGRGIGAHIRM
ncbi:hypothetical protein DRE_05061 [Drechslerella stenobrocha 248]|uniref:Pre-rRNA processing protein n=1 Tax=Drechslerella stenobrocha 248 TaxID=1043628 RepID=W7HRC3_9PEZI|nr:hypothetical protein DRE_05061 [Drechslerella stenobrocha 248]